MSSGTMHRYHTPVPYTGTGSTYSQGYQADCMLSHHQQEADRIKQSPTRTSARLDHMCCSRYIPCMRLCWGAQLNRDHASRRVRVHAYGTVRPSNVVHELPAQYSLPHAVFRLSLAHRAVTEYLITRAACCWCRVDGPLQHTSMPVLQWPHRLHT